MVAGTQVLNPSVPNDLKGPYEICGPCPSIPEQPKLQTGQVGSPGASAGRKRTASNAELELPEIKRSKVDESGAILLDDENDDDLVLL